ncbi:MAG TPA: hypothetical protein VF755_15215 [Catenuloplanes sp.]|jgi:hypothetical protein
MRGDRDAARARLDAARADVARLTAEAQAATSRAEQAEGRHDALLAALAGGGYTRTGTDDRPDRGA